MNECESLLRGGKVKDGRVYFRIAYDFDVDPDQKKAFKAGMEMWNKHSKTTGFEFEDAKTGRHDFRLQKGAPRHLNLHHQAELETKQCATYVPLGSYIWYSPEGMKRVIEKAGLDAAASAYAHELGHALNICHKLGSDLMRAGDSEMDCDLRAKKLPREIPEGDLDDAKICGRDVRKWALEEDKEIERFRKRRQEEQQKPTPQTAPPVPHD